MGTEGRFPARFASRKSLRIRFEAQQDFNRLRTVSLHRDRGNPRWGAFSQRHSGSLLSSVDSWFVVAWHSSDPTGSSSIFKISVERLQRCPRVFNTTPSLYFDPSLDISTPP